MNNQSLITIAIENKQIITFEYNGLPRKVEPHHLGLLNGELHLHAFQIAGESQTGHPWGWKNFALARMKYLLLTKHFFTPRESHSPENSNYSSIEYAIQNR